MGAYVKLVEEALREGAGEMFGISFKEYSDWSEAITDLDYDEISDKDVKRFKTVGDKVNKLFKDQRKWAKFIEAFYSFKWKPKTKDVLKGGSYETVSLTPDEVKARAKWNKEETKRLMKAFDFMKRPEKGVLK